MSTAASASSFEPSPSSDPPTLQRVWERAGRPGADKLQFAAKRAGLQIKGKEAREFVRAQAVAQVFRQPPGSTGRITAAQENLRWQADLLDYKTKSAELNDGFRSALVVTDIFSRKVYTEPMRTKTPAEAAQAFEKILGEAQTVPAEVATDRGQEFKGAFSELLDRLGISQLYKEGINSLTVNDAAMRTLKATAAREMTASGDNSWVRPLMEATEAHNSNAHSHLMGSAPNDVKGSDELQYALEKQAGEDVAHNHTEHVKRMRKLLETGTFRVLLPTREWSRTGEPRYSEKVHRVDYLVGAAVVNTDGAKFLIRDVLAVPAGSQDVKVPREIRGGNPRRQNGRQVALRPFAEALKGFLGDGSLTLQGAGTKLRQVPGFAAKMTEQRLQGIGALQRFIALFPEFVIEGQAPRARVRLTEGSGSGSGASRQ